MELNNYEGIDYMEYLKAKIKDSPLTNVELMEVLGIPKTSWYRKINNSDFNICELRILIKVLGLSDEDILNIIK